VKRCIASLFVALVAFPTAAFAIPPEHVRRQWEPPPLVTRADPGPASHLPARGTDAAAPDQQASRLAAAPVTTSSDSGLDLAEAGLIGGAALAAFAIAGAVGLHRRRAAPLAG
jgi:hypothetical protein